MEGNVYVDPFGDPFNDNNNDCETDLSDPNSNGVNERKANPGADVVKPNTGELLLQNYPNPFAKQTTINYHVPEGKQKLKL